MLPFLRFGLVLASAWCGLGCSPAGPPPGSPPAEYRFAPTEYTVLAQKALTYQADFDTLAWADMLAERVVWPTPGAPSTRLARHHLVSAWSAWRQAHGIRRLHLRSFSNFPLHVARPLALSGQRGVHVLTYCTITAERADGRHTTHRLSLCCHFDDQKRIDGYWLYDDPPDR